MLLYVSLMQSHDGLRNHQDLLLKNNEFELLLIASDQPGNQTLVPASVAELSGEDNKTLKPYSTLPEAA